MNKIKGISDSTRFIIQQMVDQVRREAYAEGFEVGKALATVKTVEEQPYTLMHGFVWEVKSNKGEKWRILTEGQMLDEALTEFRRRFGYEIDIFSITYFDKRGEFDVKH